MWLRVIALWQACGLTRPWNDPTADIALARRGPHSTILIGRDGDAIVATAMVGHDGHRGWVYYVATDPDRRARGYGRAIMNAAEDWLRAAGIAKLQLLVRRENAHGGSILPIDRLRRSPERLFSPNGSTAATDAVTPPWRGEGAHESAKPSCAANATHTLTDEGEAQAFVARFWRSLHRARVPSGEA